MLRCREPADAPEAAHEAPLPPLLEAWSQRPVPVGRFRRLRLLGTLQAKIAAAYLFHWLRGWFKERRREQAARWPKPIGGRPSACSTR